MWTSDVLTAAMWLLKRNGLAVTDMVMKRIIITQNGVFDISSPITKLEVYKP